MQTLSIEYGINVQSEQLADWKKKLKTKVYNDLVTFATKNNHLAITGWDITRGDNLIVWIENY